MQNTVFFDTLWKDYITVAPLAKQVAEAVLEFESRIVNDHIAFRTFSDSPIDLPQLEPHLLSMGYERLEPYEFPAKKLRAYGYVHEDQTLPRIFLSELKVHELSDAAQKIIRGLADQIPADHAEDISCMWSGTPWEPIARADYEALAEESEYAGWMALWGLRANHFTISVNYLERFRTLEELLDFLEERGFRMNTSGGRVKGSPEVLLEQASTLADEVPVTFAGGEMGKAPSCYYEFARRYENPKTGKLYQGFVAASADRIFESTDRSR